MKLEKLQASLLHRRADTVWTVGQSGDSCDGACLCRTEGQEQGPLDFGPTSIDYDQRIFSFREWDWTFSLTLLHSRARLQAALGDYQKGRLKGHTPTSATLVKRRGGTYFLHIQIKSQAPRPRALRDVLGVDLGRRDIAHTSDDQNWSGQTLTALRDWYSRVRAALQKKPRKAPEARAGVVGSFWHGCRGRNTVFNARRTTKSAKTWWRMPAVPVVLSRWRI